MREISEVEVVWENQFSQSCHRAHILSFAEVITMQGLGWLAANFNLLIEWLELEGTLKII